MDARAKKGAIVSLAEGRTAHAGKRADFYIGSHEDAGSGFRHSQDGGSFSACQVPRIGQWLPRLGPIR